MSGTCSEKAGHIPDMAERCPEHDQLFLALFPTWHNNVRNVARIIAYQCNVSGLIPDITGPVPDIIAHIPDVRMMFRTSFSTIFWSLALYRTSHFDVWNMARKYWPYSRLRNLTSGTWPGNTGHTPDIAQ